MTDRALMIHVRFFAAARERIGRDGESIQIDPGARVRDALAQVLARWPELARVLPYCQIAVNHAIVGADHALAGGDELAILPPVAGGMGDAPAADDRGGRRARVAGLVSGRAPSLDACVAAVRGPDMGGIVTFTGQVRARSQGRDVTELEYEAYPEMVARVFAALCDEVEAEWPGVRVAVEHATGLLVVGDIAVVIAVAAPHRAEAFAACRAVIDRLKERAPIWKKERGPDGDEWVGMGP